MKNLFQPEDLKKIEAAIGVAEKQTSGEIVTLILPAASDYWSLSFAGGIFGALMGSLVAYGWHLTHPAWGLSFEWALSLPLFGFLMGVLPLRSAAVIRAVAPKALLTSCVHRETLAHFTALGLARTRDRSGILIVISLCERRVELLADQGIHSRHESGYWKELVDELIAAIKAGNATEGVVALIRALADDLAHHFPTKTDDTNELNNRVLVGRQY